MFPHPFMKARYQWLQQLWLVSAEQTNPLEKQFDRSAGPTGLAATPRTQAESIFPKAIFIRSPMKAAPSPFIAGDLVSLVG
jgi:hypothetical protein